MNISILGPQGSGKGTQAEKLAEKYGLVHVETGKILRKLVKSDHPLAENIREIMNQGQLVSDEILAQVITEQVTREGANKGIVFDGTPRNLAQYGLIKKLLVQMGRTLDKVLFLKISPEESVKRMSSRRTCSNCGEVYNLLTNPPKEADVCDICQGKLEQREDDKPEIIARRLAKFSEATTPVIDQARTEGLLIEIDGEKSIEEIFTEIVNKLGI